MSIRRFECALAAAAVLIGSSNVPLARTALPTNGALHLVASTAWTKICKDNDPTSLCFTTQDFAEPTGGPPVVALAVYATQGRQLIFRFLTPKTFVLDAGLQFTINGVGGRANFKTCNDTGCFAEARGSSAMLNAYRKGGSMTVRAAGTTGNRVTLVVPLAGFSEGFDGPQTNR